ncbi:MAG TPA: hypothetical protein VHA56_07755 [Mucilaginibacter sp.]|nr:hypothetical protein [Mucilaginibacter sp.]
MADKKAMKQPSLRKLNCKLTKRVIALHQKGYTDDFLPVNSEKIKCVQNGESFAIQDLFVKLIDCSYDRLTHTYQYIHTIDTQAGCRGLLVMNGILKLTN